MLRTFNTKIKSLIGFSSINVLKNVIGIIRSKILAVFYGVEQVGVLGQFLTFFNLQSRLVIFGSSAAIINSYNKTKQQNLDIKPILFISIVVVLFTNLVNNIIILLFLEYFSELIFNNGGFKLLIIAGLMLNMAYSISSIIEYCFQAAHKFKELAIARLLAIVGGVIIIIPLTIKFKVLGVIITMMIMYIITFIYLVKALDFLRYIRLYFIKDLIKKIKKQQVINFLKIATTDFNRSILVIGSLFITRLLIVKYYGLIYSGYYQSIISISNYINVIAEGFIVYYFPVIGSLNDKNNIRDEYNSSLELILFIILPIIFLIIIFVEPVLYLLYSKDFIVMATQLRWVIASKILFIFYYLNSLNYLSQNLLKKFIVLEAIRSLFLVILTFYSVVYLNFNDAVYTLILTEVISIIVIQGINFLSEEKYFKLSKENTLLLLISIIVSIFLAIDFILIWIKILFLSVFFVVFNVHKRYLIVFKRLFRM